MRVRGGGFWTGFTGEWWGSVPGFGVAGPGNIFGDFFYKKVFEKYFSWTGFFPNFFRKDSKKFRKFFFEMFRKNISGKNFWEIRK
jgi:hypothetical protein